MKVDFCMMVFGSGSILVLKSIYSTETWGKFSLDVFSYSKCQVQRSHICRWNHSGICQHLWPKFTLDDAKIDGREFCSKEDKSGLQINHSHLALMFFGDYNSHAVLYFVSSRFLPLDLLYFKTVAILMHDTSNSLTPTNISNLFAS